MLHLHIRDFQEVFKMIEVVFIIYLALMTAWAIIFALTGNYEKALTSIIFFVVMPFVLLIASVVFIMFLCLVPLLALFSKSFRDTL